MFTRAFTYTDFALFVGQTKGLTVKVWINTFEIQTTKKEYNIFKYNVYESFEMPTLCL